MWGVCLCFFHFPPKLPCLDIGVNCIKINLKVTYITQFKVTYLVMQAYKSYIQISMSLLLAYFFFHLRVPVQFQPLNETAPSQQTHTTATFIVPFVESVALESSRVRQLRIIRSEPLSPRLRPCRDPPPNSVGGWVSG